MLILGFRVRGGGLMAVVLGIDLDYSGIFGGV